MAIIPMQQRADTAANWTSVNPVLRLAEIGYETDTGNVKYGDGVTPWVSLAYFSADSGELPLPSGTPSAGQVPVATGTGQASEWETLGGTILNNRGGIQPSTAYNPGDVVAYKGETVLITQAVTSTAWSNWYTLPSLTSGTYVPIENKRVFYASDWGVVADSATDSTSALQKCLWECYNNEGGVVVLPGGNIGAWIYISNTIIIPSGVVVCGQGIESTFIKLAANSNCDMVQFATYNSSAQATILASTLGAGAPSAGSIRNAFYSGLMNLALDGNGANQSASSYNNGLTATTNPIETGAPTDPNYDPTNFLFNVEITGCTGDGYNQLNSRGQMRVTNCLFRSNTGWGVVSGTDTLYTGCNFAENGIGGFYSQHTSASGAAAKVYNNGTNAQWVTGGKYTANQRVMYDGSLYGAINATGQTPAVPASGTTVTNSTAFAATVTVTGGTVTNVEINGVSAGTGDGNYSLPSGETITLTYSAAPTWTWVLATTSPAVDTTDWVEITGATEPDFWGTGMLIAGSTAQQMTWSSVGFQENSGSDIYLQGAAGVRISGNSSTPNVNQSANAQNTTNPSNYASVVLDDSSGNMVDIAATSTGTAYLIRNINGSTHNDLRFTGDASWAAVVTPDSTALAGSGNRVVVNGATVVDAGVALAANNLSDLASTAAALKNLGGMGLVATTGTAGFALQNATPTILTWTAPDDGQLHRLMVFGAVHVTSTTTGGQVSVAGQLPDGSDFVLTLMGAGQEESTQSFTSRDVIVQPGSTVTLTQSSAVTAGAATLWAEIWAL